jgi:hypothetical protein
MGLWTRDKEEERGWGWDLELVNSVGTARFYRIPSNAPHDDGDNDASR